MEARLDGRAFFFFLRLTFDGRKTLPKHLAAALALLAAPALGTPVLAQAPVEQAADNQELAEMYAQDQEVRQRLLAELKPKEDGSFSVPPELVMAMVSGDAQRLARTEEMFRTGALKTAQDYYHAAFIFQHGKEPESYLRAHHAALVAMKLGHENASWIAAASLDRYLVNIGQPQIYGTQSKNENGQTVVSEADPDIMPNRERGMLDVPPLAGAD